jgi:uncharacterized protein YegL
MAKKTAEIVCILDRSGSMEHLTDATIDGFNEFIAKQRELPGRARVSLVLFDHEYELVYADKSLKKVKKLNNKTYYTRGMTALLDAVGRTIEDVANRYVANNGSPDKTVFFIITDGQENSSSDYNREQVKEMVTEYQAVGWDFFFLGANIDSFSEAGSIGIRGANTVDYDPTYSGTKAAYTMASAAVASSRLDDDVEDTDWKS